ncbi:MAG: hypothetical protein C4520_17870 [Candidatus Abyssobacteria bacterium SURF_5]|uniref:Uncharacterized protein n=1 Tax=Abyssobacteria bacterium (strain SURF_5) TaxID=2093360 RepID=A0A3A4NIP0_ABYX5|nr:MAG: hypothetical protein C4520_17870 [Candidatus Abyssubacteria bacterium SURF_5]
MNSFQPVRFATFLLVFFLAALPTPIAEAENEGAPPGSAQNAASYMEEPWAVSGHPIGDTIGRGLDFLLKPAYVAGSSLYFLVLPPPEPEHITGLEMHGCPPVPPSAEPVEPPAEPAQPSPETAPPSTLPGSPAQVEPAGPETSGEVQPPAPETSLEPEPAQGIAEP